MHIVNCFRLGQSNNNLSDQNPKIVYYVFNLVESVLNRRRSSYNHNSLLGRILTRQQMVWREQLHKYSRGKSQGTVYVRSGTFVRSKCAAWSFTRNRRIFLTRQLFCLAMRVQSAGNSPRIVLLRHRKHALCVLHGRWNTNVETSESFLRVFVINRRPHRNRSVWN